MDILQRSKKLMILALVVIGFVLYLPNIHNQLFWDDTDWIVHNPNVHAFSVDNLKSWFTENTLAGIGLRSNYYRPLLFATFTINYVIDGTNPIGYHLVNNGLHVANGVLIFVLLLGVFSVPWIPFFVALFFVIHPLQTEAITYVAGRGDPLNVFFMLLGLWFLSRTYRLPGQSVRWYGATLLCLAFALLSRETAIIFPFLVWIYAVAFLEEGRLWPAIRQAFVRVMPFFGLVLVYGILRLTVLNFDNTLNFYTNPNPYSEHFLVRMYTFLGILLTYARLLIVPLGQHMERSAAVFGSLFHWQVFIPFLVVVGLVSWTIYLGRTVRTKPHPGRIDFSRVLLFGVGWFFVNLGPTSGITPINALLYEHWLYLAMVGPLVVVSYGVYQVWVRWEVYRTRRILLLILIVGVVGSYSVLTVKRNIAWGDPLRFFEDILTHEPESARINNNVGNIYFERREYTKAEEHYWRATEAQDAFPQPHYNLGSILYGRKDIRGALVEFQRAVEIDPNFPYAYQGLAVIYAEQGDLVSARAAIVRVVELQPGNPRAYYDLARLNLAMNNRSEAIEALQRGLQVSGNDPEIAQAIQDILAGLSK